MKATLALLISLFALGNIPAQAPKLYVHIVSHNEPNDNLDAPPGINYNKAKSKILTMAGIVNDKNAKWNLQTSDGFVIGALQYDAAGTSATDVFEILSSPPYKDNIEIDPRSKNKDGRNIADLWYLLDSCGANPTTHLGGCIYSTTNPAIQPIDWLKYRKPVIGNIYGNAWQCSIITGAGSYPPHTNDLNDFGVFKPDTTTNFYHHNSAKNLWCMGTGCAPVLDSLADEQAIIDLIQAQADSIQNGLWPSDKFYITRIMTNQREYGPLFFKKIARVIDSLNLIPASKLQWATVSECFAAFQSWQASSGLEYSQWRCGQTVTGAAGPEVNEMGCVIYPNPSDGVFRIELPDEMPHLIELYDLFGNLILKKEIAAATTIDYSQYRPGLYFLSIDKRHTRKIVKN